MKNVLLVRMGEIFLKGDNRNFFIKALVRNLRKALEGTDCTLELTQGRIFLRDIQDMDEVIRRATRVFGVHSVSPVVECEKDMEVICARAIELMENCTGTFKCVARRADKRFPWTPCRSTRRSATACSAPIPASRWTSTSPSTS